MKTRTTVRSIFNVLISIASVIFIILPFVVYPSLDAILGGNDVVVHYYELINFKEINYSAYFIEELTPLREAASYLTIIVISVGSASLFFATLNFILYKPKFVRFLSAFFAFLLTFAALGLGIVTLIYRFTWQNVVIEVWGDLAETFKITSLGGWLYIGLGLLIPVNIFLTNFIKK